MVKSERTLDKAYAVTRNGRIYYRIDIRTPSKVWIVFSLLVGSILMPLWLLIDFCRTMWRELVRRVLQDPETRRQVTRRRLALAEKYLGEVAEKQTDG